MRPIKTALVEVMLRRINYIAHRDGASLHRRASAMPQCVRCRQLVTVGEKWNHSSPRTFAGHSQTV